MQETVGMLELRIARLEQQLKVIEKQQALSSPYPAHQANLRREYVRLLFELKQLAQKRQSFSRSTLAA